MLSIASRGLTLPARGGPDLVHLPIGAIQYLIERNSFMPSRHANAQAEVITLQFPGPIKVGNKLRDPVDHASMRISIL
jgi:hypothetical protein